MTRHLDIVGAGHVGRALGRAWAESGAFEIRRVCNRSLASARQAVEFIGQGTAVSNLGEERSETVMISTSDSAIGAASRILLESNIITAETVVFHCSGVQSFELLAPLKRKGAHIASSHPVKSFADAELAVRTLAGTCFSVEGDDHAIEVLTDALRSIGGRLLRISPPLKSVYHAGSVFACGNLAATLAAGMECLRVSGLSTEDAASILRPIAVETVDIFFARGAAAALTGPIVRGEVSIVENQLNDIQKISPEIAGAYRALGTLVVSIAARQGKLSQQTLGHFSAVFAGTTMNPTRTL